MYFRHKKGLKLTLVGLVIKLKKDLFNSYNTKSTTVRLGKDVIFQPVYNMFYSHGINKNSTFYFFGNFYLNR